MALRTTKVVLSAMFLALAASCSSPEPDTAEICMDEDTQTRVADEECEDDFRLKNPTKKRRQVYVPFSSGVPGIGGRVSSYSTVKSGVIGKAGVGGGYSSGS